MPIIAKIEKHEAIDNIDAIVGVADGVMVARGDLGVEIDLERVPLVQKMIIRKANAAGKPVITATQMLLRMVDNPRPTRAEATDVANAILDGTDALMLSEETAAGKYPLEAARMMGRIANSIEESLDPAKIWMAAFRLPVGQRCDQPFQLPYREGSRCRGDHHPDLVGIDRPARISVPSDPADNRHDSQSCHPALSFLMLGRDPVDNFRCGHDRRPDLPLDQCRPRQWARNGGSARRRHRWYPLSTSSVRRTSSKCTRCE